MFSVTLPFKRVAVLAALMASAATMQAAVSLPAIFSDRMVLQQADKVPVWGWANAGEEVTVSLNGINAKTKAGADGRWQLELNLAKTGQGPFNMQVKGENTIEIDDVLVGQVWLASGQSNMEWRLRNTTDSEAEIAAGAGNLVREFRVSKATHSTPQKDVKGQWYIAEPGQTSDFSAVGYFFAKKLNQELKQPVAIVHSSWGGTPSEAWTSREALASDENLSRSQDRRNDQVESYPQRKADFDAGLTAWLAQHDLADGGSPEAAQFAGSDVDTSGWASVSFGNEVKHSDLPERGIIWLRREVTVPEANAGKDLRYQVQQGRGFFTVYWNGERVGGPDVWNQTELGKLRGQNSGLQYIIPGKLVKAGENTIAIRIYSPLQIPGRMGWRNNLSGPQGFDRGMNDNWKAKAEKEFNIDAAALAAAPEPVVALPDNHHQPARLFNAMIAPIVPYRLAGVIWYQGESNAGRAWQYRTAFPLLIEDWRKQWDEPNLPFYFCQLANYMGKSQNPGESNWAELREAQTYTLKLPNTGQAVLIDIGEAEDIHPRNKRDVGDRLALLALKNDYGRGDVVAVGPTYLDNNVIGNKMYIKFEDVGKGSELVAHDLPDTYPLKTLNNTSAKLVLPSPDSQLQGFMICGADKKWVWAQAKIEGKHGVVVWSPQVEQPVAVRYAWSNNPTCNLYNKSGLPAVPFRTDDFPAASLNGRF